MSSDGPHEQQDLATTTVQRLAEHGIDVRDPRSLDRLHAILIVFGPQALNRLAYVQMGPREKWNRFISDWRTTLAPIVAAGGFLWSFGIFQPILRVIREMLMAVLGG